LYFVFALAQRKNEIQKKVESIALPQAKAAIETITMYIILLQTV
jgi:hypothetical protein